MHPLVLLLALCAGGERFFERKEVSFWGSRTPSSPPPELWPEAHLPAPVRGLLEAPSRERAEAYLSWQETRLRMLRSAMAAVEEAKRAHRAPVLYFAREGCRFCELQEKELEGLPVVRVPEDSPLWKRYDVRLTPTLVVGQRVLRGLTPRDVLRREMIHE